MNRRPYASGRSLAPVKLTNPKLAAKQEAQLKAFWAPVPEVVLTPEQEEYVKAEAARLLATGLFR